MKQAIELRATVDIPGSPLPRKFMTDMCYRFRGIGGAIAKMMPGIGNELKQADIHVQKELFCAALFVTSTTFFLGGALLAALFVAAVNAKRIAYIDTTASLAISVGFGFLFAAMTGMRILMYPRIVLKRKVRDLERNIVFALRTMLIQIRSGVTLFDAINSVANGNNGQVSVEFRKAVKRIDTGTYQNDALEEIAENNPSLHFRRAIWQLVNGLKAGSDVSQVMESLVETLSNEKLNQIKRYGNSLKMLSLMYMMLGAIFPGLGLTLLIILSIFPQVKITDTVFWGMFMLIMVGQFMFIGIIKNSRPSLMGE